MAFQGDGVTELLGSTRVSDGSWHEIRVVFSHSGEGSISIDGRKEAKRGPRQSSSPRSIDLGGLYFGGIDPSKRARALSQGVDSVGEQLQVRPLLVRCLDHHHLQPFLRIQGCLLDIELNGSRLGLPDVKETSGVKADCVWTFPCLEKDAGSKRCHKGASCVQKGTGGYECKCPGGEDCSGNDATQWDIYDERVSITGWQFFHFALQCQGCSTHVGAV